MQDAMVSALEGWESFYVIVGSSAAALTGLQFVVMTLLDGARQRGHPVLTADEGSLGAFGTPTVVHFCATLLVACIVSAPWETIVGVRRALVVVGAAGLAYAAITTWRARKQSSYQPVLEDWLFHSAFPIVAYAGVVFGATLLPRDEEDALFVVGGMALFLLFIGIHNAWDTVTYLATQAAKLERGSSPDAAQPHRPQSSRRRRHSR